MLRLMLAASADVTSEGFRHSMPRFCKPLRKPGTLDLDVHWISTFDLLIRCSADVNSVDELGRNCLVHALLTEDIKGEQDALGIIWKGSRASIDAGMEALSISDDHDLQAGIVRTLLQHKACANSSVHGVTAVMLAALTGNTNVCEWLLNARASASERDGNGRTALHYAVVIDNCKLVNLLLQRHPTLGYVSDMKCRSPLMFAIQYATDCVPHLLPHSHVNVWNIKGRNALMYAVFPAACEDPDLELVARLLRARADVRQRDRGRCSVFHYAVRAASSSQPADTSVVAVLAEARADPGALDWRRRSALHHAAVCGKDAFIEGLSRLGVDVEAADAQGSTPLSLAAAAGHLACVRALLAARAGLTGSSGGVRHGAAAPLAAAAPRWPVLQLLLEARADAGKDQALVRVVANAKYSYTDALALRACIEGLLSHGARPDACDERGRSCLMLAVMQNAEMERYDADPWARKQYYVDAWVDGGLLAMLVQHALDVNLTDFQGRTALMYAAGLSWSAHPFMRDLIRAQADVNIVDHRGWTALMYAAGQNILHLQTVSSLLRAGALPNVGRFECAKVAASRSYGSEVYSLVCLTEICPAALQRGCHKIWAEHVIPFLVSSNYADCDDDVSDENATWSNASLHLNSIVWRQGHQKAGRQRKRKYQYQAKRSTWNDQGHIPGL
eukprot:TRINITY_DN67779_c0_g1_i1.p1 TRINITY_DN67779_c0_g1~~TRINITY_DN67779_c0_g1_i1.p1  ORF type:complete len:696 (-),score=84.47 TRINITY_DN67779_c0_g1_i1:17-2038(-)